LDSSHGTSPSRTITDIDNQGEVPKGSIIDRDNQESFSLIITDNQAFSPQDMPQKSEAKAAVAHRSVHQRHHRTQSVLKKLAPAPSPDAVGAKKARTSTIAGRSRWEDCIVSHIRRFCFHSRSLAGTSSL
jgi:hypothetical protein